MTSDMTVGQRVRERRKELGISQEELGKRLGGISRAAVCNVEKDKEVLTLDRVRKYAEALHCSPGYLAGWVDRADDRAIKMYESYLEQNPEVQSAIETLLEAPRKKS
jgi:repressor LexA